MSQDYLLVRETDKSRDRVLCNGQLDVGEDLLRYVPVKGRYQLNAFSVSDNLFEMLGVVYIDGKAENGGGRIALPINKVTVPMIRALVDGLQTVLEKTETQSSQSTEEKQGR